MIRITCLLVLWLCPMVSAVRDLVCIQCESHKNGTETTECMVYGFVFREQVSQVPCQYGACYTTLETVNGVEVASRGCSKNLKELPFYLPKDGCYGWKGKDICLCYSPMCNELPAGKSDGEDLVEATKNKGNGKVECYQCLNYDKEGNHYDQCPKYDGVDPKRVHYGTCNGTCFTRSYSDNPKKVGRGCTDTQWGLPVPLPDDGCYNWEGGVWCVCSTSGCNDRGIGRSSGKDLDYNVQERLKNYKEEDGLNRCYECINYDSKGNYYKQCPKNNRVRNAYYRVCNETCFTRSYDYNPDKVARGCTDTQWGLPDPLPPDGCYKWYSEVWCVCSTTRCNGFAIGKAQDIEFDAHIAKGKHNGGMATSLVFESWNLVSAVLVVIVPMIAL